MWQCYHSSVTDDGSAVMPEDVNQECRCNYIGYSGKWQILCALPKGHSGIHRDPEGREWESYRYMDSRLKDAAERMSNA